MISEVTMSLLTKEERQSLNRDDRRALRRRRSRRSKDQRRVSLNIEWLKDRAVELIKEQVSMRVPGPAKMDLVLEELADLADEYLIWNWAGVAGPILELVDGPVVRALVHLAIRPHVQAAYDELADLGMLED
jgi:hypothetical protein